MAILECSGGYLSLHKVIRQQPKSLNTRIKSDPPEEFWMTTNSDRVSRAIRGIKKPKGILFDLGNTILRQEKFDPEAGTARVLELAENPKGLSVKHIQDLVEELRSES